MQNLRNPSQQIKHTGVRKWTYAVWKTWTGSISWMKILLVTFLQDCLFFCEITSHRCNAANDSCVARTLQNNVFWMSGSELRHKPMSHLLMGHGGRFGTYTAAGHQGATKMFSCHSFHVFHPYIQSMVGSNEANEQHYDGTYQASPAWIIPFAFFLLE